MSSKSIMLQCVPCYEKVCILAACCSTANKQARLVEREVYFRFGQLGGWWGGGGHLSKGRLSLLATSGQELAAQSALTVIFKLIIDGLTSITLF